MPKYRWEPDAGFTGRYRDKSTGRYVKPTVVRDSLDTYLAKSTTGVTDVLTSQLRAGVINTDDFHRSMKAHVKTVHNNAVMLERGGRKAMTQADWGRSGGYIARQNKYLDGMVSDIKSGKQKLDGTLTRRASMYTEAARESFYKSRMSRAGDVGATHVASRLSPADHCEECVKFDGVFYEIGDKKYKHPGQRICLTSCKCYEIYATLTPDGFEVMSDEFGAPEVESGPLSRKVMKSHAGRRPGKFIENLGMDFWKWYMSELLRLS